MTHGSRADAQGSLRLARSSPPIAAQTHSDLEGRRWSQARRSILLLAPGVAMILVLLILPLLIIAEESLQQYVPGRVGGADDKPYTFSNYTELLDWAYLRYLWDMIRIGLISTILGILIAFPIAHFIARRRSGPLRTICLGFVVGFLFLSVLVRVYSIELAFGAVGFGTELSNFFGTSSSSRAYAEFLVVVGLLYHNVPLSTLVLIGTIQNINPRMLEAAILLGASRCQAHLTITVPLSMNGLVSAFLINYMIAISAFVIPMVLGKGKVVFMSNLIYSRFGEVANYPSGSAIAIALLALSFLMIYGITRAARLAWVSR